MENHVSQEKKKKRERNDAQINLTKPKQTETKGNK